VPSRAGVRRLIGSKHQDRDLAVGLVLVVGTTRGCR
jgi:hypothetical protein